jgi:hypothetical protein
VQILVDEIVATTGFRPDLDMLREVRIELDPAVEATPTLAPLIDPNIHSCGTVRPHGEAELRHPEKNFYIVGMKSYGRAPHNRFGIGQRSRLVRLSEPDDAVFIDNQHGPHRRTALFIP